MAEQTTTTVVVFLNDRVCSDCENHALGSGGVFCTKYREEILDEGVARECPDYDPVPWAGRRKP